MTKIGAIDGAVLVSKKAAQKSGTKKAANKATQKATILKGGNTDDQIL